MKNILDYVESELESFNQRRFNSIDSLILSQVSNFEFGNLVGNINKIKSFITFHDLLKTEYFPQLLGSMVNPNLNKSLLYALSSSPRFRDIKINFYVNKIEIDEEKQFAAITFILDKKTAYIAFKGTDDSFIGWKEDFNMAFVSPVPSQVEGVRYINKVASILSSYNLYVGGHSKGGNIAVYASMHCKKSISSRITSIFTHDGPGFREEVINSKRFNDIKNKINKTIPHSSVVGMLLENHEEYKIVKSNAIGIMQHNPFTWEVKGIDFYYVDSVSSTSKYFNKTLNQWLNNISDDKRKLFVDSLFDVLSSTNVNSFSQLANDWKTNLPIILESLKNLDPEIKSIILQLLKELRNLYIKNSYPVEKLNRINIPSKPVVTPKFRIRKYSKKRNYCVIKIKKK